jgi:ATP adenylyltransferase
VVDHLWSPWRMQYIQEAKEEPDGGGCVFCAIPHTEVERVLVQGELAYVVLNKFPYNPGHILVVPLRHVGELEDVTAEENAELQALLQRAIRAIRRTADPHGFNIGLNLGRMAGAGIPEHLHWHVVPRWSGDTNFMPVVGDTRVLPELLGETYQRLKPGFEA